MTTTSVAELADRYVDRFAALDPCMAALMGIAGQDARLTDYGPDGVAARTDLARRTLAELDALPVTGDRERVAAAVLRDRLATDLALDEAHAREAVLDTTDGAVQRLKYAFELLDQGERTDWASLLGRLRALPATVAGLRVSLDRAAAHGRVPARRQIARSIADARTAPAYLTALAARHAPRPGPQDGPGHRELTGAARAAARAFQDLADHLATDLMPRAGEQDAVGADRYRLGVRDNLGTTVDLHDTYAWGWEELARVEAEMARAAAQISPGAPVAAVRDALDRDPAHRVTGAAAFRDWIQDLADQAIDALDGVHFDIPAPLRRVDCRIPPGEAGIYYLAPAEDGSRPGTVWWTAAPDADIATWTVPGILFHETAPGHHLQLGTTTFHPGLNRFQRTASELHPGHCEGWGLYAERLMDELGHYRDPAHRFGMLAGGQQFRAARVVLDIGLHLRLPIPAGTGFHEGERWTPALAREFLRAHTGGETDASLAFEVDRYLGRPGQAIAYKLGEKVWLEAREAARRRDGAAFDLKDFHRRALDLGPMGLDRLRTELARP
ncbi:DUF885 domain-containing protein [Actinomadura hibisca]|uniref:DUF885 domain-containing protein n=1 Tax=Actinomadura hibisca TaxID=68565 RepID=UPI000837A812|nr:DUF885 domain-containing protein [Actinomadura hibisca]